jgi:CRISPR-associated protein Csm4
MTLYRITLQICSPLITPLKGDTIWGHFVWGIANHEGDEAVAEFLDQGKRGAPGLVVSSAFPSGLLCMPLPKPEERAKKSLNADEYAAIKLRKKLKYVNACDYFNGVPEAEIERAVSFKSAQVMHNTIERSSNTVQEGGLYTVNEYWLGKIMDKTRYKDVEWDIYLLTSFSADRVKELCEWAFENGYGADASTGKGKIFLKGSPQAVSPKKQSANYMALGPFVNEGNAEITDLRSDIFVRNGKIGGAFAPHLSPYKKTIVLYDEGAVFSSQKSLEFIGKMMTGVHGTDPRICQSAFAPVVPVD